MSMLFILIDILFIVLGAIFIVLYLNERIKRASVKAAAFKTAASVMFLFTAILPIFNDALLFNEIIVIVTTVVGLLFGLLGDIFLDLKFVHNQYDTSYTYLGFGAFSIGHIFYIVSLILFCIIKCKWFSPLHVLIALVIGIVIGIINGLSGKLMHLNYGRFQPIVIVYGAILFSMVLLSAVPVILDELGITAAITRLVGGILFIISDLILSRMYFGNNREKPAFIIANIVTYYTAQFLIAFSMMFFRYR